MTDVDRCLPQLALALMLCVACGGEEPGPEPPTTYCASPGRYYCFCEIENPTCSWYTHGDFQDVRQELTQQFCSPQINTWSTSHTITEDGVECTARATGKDTMKEYPNMYRSEIDMRVKCTTGVACGYRMDCVCDRR